MEDDEEGEEEEEEEEEGAMTVVRSLAVWAAVVSNYPWAGLVRLCVMMVVMMVMRR